MNMQEDAIRRVREMQRRADFARNDANESFGYQGEFSHDQEVNSNNNYYDNHQAPRRQEPENSYTSPSNNTQYNQSRQSNESNYHGEHIDQNTHPQDNQRNSEHNNQRNDYDSQQNENTQESDNSNQTNQNNSQSQNNTNTTNNNSRGRSSSMNNIFGNLFNDSSLSSIFGNNGLGNLSGILGNSGLNLNAILEKISDPERGEQILLLGMLILLSNEEADRLLLLAILYIMID